MIASMLKLDKSQAEHQTRQMLVTSMQNISKRQPVGSMQDNEKPVNTEQVRIPPLMTLADPVSLSVALHRLQALQN